MEEFMVSISIIGVLILAISISASFCIFNNRKDKELRKFLGIQDVTWANDNPIYWKSKVLLCTTYEDCKYAHWRTRNAYRDLNELRRGVAHPLKV